VAQRVLAMHPGTVDVAVLEPVPTSGWAADDLHNHVAYVRPRLLDTLDNRPGATLRAGSARATRRFPASGE